MNIKIKREVLIIEISDSPKIESLMLWLNFNRPQTYKITGAPISCFYMAAHYLSKEVGSIFIPLSYLEDRFSKFTIDEDINCSYNDIGEILDEINIYLEKNEDSNVDVYLKIKHNFTEQ